MKDISKIRLILDSYEIMSAHIGIKAKSYDKGFSTVYGITEENYKIKDNHKIGVVGSKFLGVPDRSFYQSDLRSLIEGADNKHAGFYQLVPAVTIVVGDIVNTEIHFDNDNEILFEMPVLVTAVDCDKISGEALIETFIPTKRSFWSWLNPKYRPGVFQIKKTDIKEKLEKIPTKSIIDNKY